ncbi:DNA-binding domain-containing protein [Methylocystis sp. WRRC1]|uniref:HvfC/BufC N-terminal domain-containing protein n=1 Tax=Methylocystis sp. WRRC1 TaxID=1732014 RepID=UPI001D133EC4|nr:DNA-binding domain-containing protein [Methylocystis sp. WRRC1]MCC3246500.1 DNA-binding domain-containing protein [Methylocystis sp. WRRC1]
MKLADFQALFQGRILEGAGEGDKPLLSALRPSQRGAERETLLGVYQHGYRARLADFLGEDHPGLRALLGDEAFDALIEDYIAATPPRNRNARWYTTGLPDFMRESPRWRDDRRAVSMALFERAMVDAFDAADAEPLTIEALAQFAPEDWPRLVFGFHPSLIVLELAAGTLEAYDPSPDDEGAQAPEADGVEAVAVWRVNEESAFRGLEPDEFVALSEARAGRAFGDICQMAAFQQSGEIEPERLAQFLASWFEDGMVISARPRQEG